MSAFGVSVTADPAPSLTVMVTDFEPVAPVLSVAVSVALYVPGLW